MLSCPVCAKAFYSTVLERQDVPTGQHVLFDTEEEAIKTPRGDLDYKICHNCMFVFNTVYDASKVSYDQDYDNSQNHSSTFDKHTEEVLSYLCQRYRLEGKTVLEIGCGQGQFLEALFRRVRFTGLGFDPAFVARQLPESLSIRPEFFTDKIAVDANFIIARHLIEHLKDPITDLINPICSKFFKAIIFETPDFSWIINNGVIWDFFYEHPSLFCETSMRNAFYVNGNGYRVVNSRPIFGGQYLFTESSLAIMTKTKLLDKELLVKSLGFPWLEAKKKKTIVNAVSQYSGKIAIWGAGAKGVTLANLLDRSMIDCIVDINPRKIGRYLPGTGHKIVSPEELKDRNIQAIVLMNPIYKEETMNKLNSLSLSPEILEL